MFESLLGMQRRSLTALAAAVLVGGLASAPAHAQGYDIDIEFLRPAFGHSGFAGLDVPMTKKELTFRYGMLLQYQADPLTLYDAVNDTELGSVVTNRAAGMFGASLDVSDRVTFNLMAPTAYNWGTQQENFGADGFGLGDIGAGVKLIFVKTPRDLFNVGARGGLILPTGRDASYTGENTFRINVGLLAALNLGDSITVASDLGVMTRTEVVTDEDFTAANEMQWGNGVRFKLPAATRAAFTGQIVTRAVLQDFLSGGAENAVEAIGGLQFYPTRSLTLDFGAGRGLTEGYGTTDLRIIGGLIVEIAPPEPLPPKYVAEAPPPPPPDPPPIDELIEEPEPVFAEGVLAIVADDQILIKDMIEFIVDTNSIQEYSRPVLEDVARVINKNWNLAHLVIEGHASQEGGTDHNYELAESRARRIWEELLELGVGGERISYRGYGEVRPITGEVGSDDLTEEQLQANRRVEFHISHYFDDPATTPYAKTDPPYPTEQYLPWSGVVVPVVMPELPEITAPEDEGPELDEYGLPIGIDDEDDIEFDIGAPPGDTGTDDEE